MCLNLMVFMAIFNNTFTEKKYYWVGFCWSTKALADSIAFYHFASKAVCINGSRDTKPGRLKPACEIE
jgi:hypothetical protein